MFIDNLVTPSIATYMCSFVNQSIIKFLEWPSGTATARTTDYCCAKLLWCYLQKLTEFFYKHDPRPQEVQLHIIIYINQDQRLKNSKHDHHYLGINR